MSSNTDKEKKHHEFLTQNADFEVRSLDAVCLNESELKHPWWYNFKYLIAGTFFGIVSVWVIRKFNIKTIYGEPIEFVTRKLNKGNIIGGLLFGFGWALTGACPGPLFAQIGTGATATIITLFSAIAGTWCYGMLRDRLPH